MLNTSTVLRAFIIVTLSNISLIGCGASETGTNANTNSDTVAPVITINGDSSVSLSKGATYTEQGAIAIDGVDGDITSKIAISGAVDTNTVGSYIITYSVIDAAGNQVIRTRTVNVIDNKIPPVISLIGLTPINIEIGASYTDAGATAIDDIDGDISNAMITVNAVNTVVVGSYAVTYDVVDVAGNAAVQVTRTVNVVAPTVVVLLNDTGIHWGGNYPTGDNATCVGETISEQDCAQGRDAQAAAGNLTKIGAGQAGFDFTKLDSSGNALADNAISWSCVKDNHTGLVWEVKTTMAGIHNKDNVYRWGGKTALLTGTFGDRFNDWDTLVDGSNSGSGLCGFTDWRVPSAGTLLSIVNFGQVDPKIDVNYFPNTNGSYWSSTPRASDSGNAYSFSNGGIGYYNGRTDSMAVRLVRGGQ